jgi:beta-RFAP synthase
MFSFGRQDGPQFGGVGAMIDSPGLRLTIRRGERFVVEGLHASRAQKFAELALANLCKQRGCEEKLPHLREQIHIEVERAPREHIGLGVGTQLGLAVAAAICSAFELRPPAATELARLIGRSPRSAIGTYGFDFGGLLIDPGRVPEIAIRERQLRAEIPAAWKFVLFCPRTATGLAGDAERAAFDRLPPVPPDVTNQLTKEAIDNLLPAAAKGDLATFSRSLYRFNHTAGLCFAAQQGGPYVAGIANDLIEFLRRDGIEGVGQSSWGPTVFALCPAEPEAADCAQLVREKFPDFDGDIVIAAPCNRGARIETL